MEADRQAASDPECRAPRSSTAKATIGRSPTVGRLGLCLLVAKSGVVTYLDPGDYHRVRERFNESTKLAASSARSTSSMPTRTSLSKPAAEFRTSPHNCTWSSTL